MGKFVLFFTFIFLFHTVSAQNFVVKGSVQDTAGVTLPGASVKIFVGTDSISTATDLNGGFSFSNVKAAEFTMHVAFIGFQKFIRAYSIDKSVRTTALEVIKLKEASNALGEITVTGVVPVRVKEDTVEYSAAAYKVREGDAVDEMLKKLPGVTVDKDGNVTIQGKPLTQLRINGKDYSGSDVATAIQNLPADIIKNLQFIDDYGDQAKLSGIKSGEPRKVLNINIQPDKNNGYNVRGTVGAGNEGRYIASARGNSFKGSQQLNFDGSMNNTNIRGGGGDGITNTKALSFNYRDEWGKKISSYGGLNYNGRDNKTSRSTYRQSIYETFTRFDNENGLNASENGSGQLFWNFEYRIDTANYIKLSPNLSYNSSTFDNSGATITTGRNRITNRDNVSSNSNANASYGANLLLNHKFKKKGRNFSVNTDVNLSKGENDRNARSDYVDTDTLGKLLKTEKQYQLTDNKNDNFRTGVNVSFSEPLRKTTFLEVNYNWNYSDTKTNRDTRDVNPLTNEEKFNTNLSNDFQYQFITNRLGVNYREIQKKYNYTLGLGFQPALLKGQNISRGVNTSKRTYNWIPNARFVYTIGKQKTFTANYSGRNNQPSFQQLQPLKDSSNLRNIVTGNPNLSPEYNHGLNLDYNESDWQAGHTLFLGASVSQVNNRIVTRKVLDPETLTQVTTYQNTNGFYNIKGNYSYGKPFQERRYTITYFGGANFNNNIAFTNNNRNVGKNLVVDQGLKFRVDIKDIVDAELNTSYALNRTTYSLATFSTRKTNRYNMTLNGRNFFLKNNDLTLGYDFSKTINTGYSANSTNPFIVNAYFEYRFMKGKRGTLRMQGFDLLNENNGINRDVFDNVIVDSQTNRLARYFLMSFNLRLNKFAAKRPPSAGGNRQ